MFDMTHVLAGPRSAMSLAEFGANVLHVASPTHLDPKTINLGVNHGKKSTFLDLQDAGDLNTLQQLLTQADVFIIITVLVWHNALSLGPRIFLV